MVFTSGQNQQPHWYGIFWQNHAAGQQKTLVGNHQLRQGIVAILAVNNDTSPHTINFLVDVEQVNTAVFGSVVVPAGAGYGSVPALDCLPLLFPSFSSPVPIDYPTGFYCINADAIPNSPVVVAVTALCLSL